MGAEPDTAFVNEYYEKAKVVTEFLEREVRPRLAKDASTPTDKTVAELFFRALMWMRSFRKLDWVNDVQALAAGTRAQLETAVDVTLLVADTSGDAIERMLAWERSSMLKYAERAVGYVDRTSGPTPDVGPMRTFIATERTAIVAARAKYWPNKHGDGTHPMRWTGKNLGEDCKVADTKRHPEVVKRWPAPGFESVYELEYARLCWFTHGSGLPGMRSMGAETFHAMCALAYLNAQHLAASTGLVAALHFKHLGRDANFGSRIIRLHRQWLALSSDDET